MKKAIFIGGIALVLLFCCIACAATAIVFNWVKNSEEYYKPQFTKSNAEIFFVRGGRQKIYIKLSNTKDIRIGDTLDNIKVIVAETLNYDDTEGQKTNDSEYYTVHQHTVTKVAKDYVVVELESAVNPDCIGVYINNQPAYPLEQIYLAGSLPGPSDSWMCSYFDFEKSLPNE